MKCGGRHSSFRRQRLDEELAIEKGCYQREFQQLLSLWMEVGARGLTNTRTM